MSFKVAQGALERMENQRKYGHEAGLSGLAFEKATKAAALELERAAREERWRAEAVAAETRREELEGGVFTALETALRASSVSHTTRARDAMDGLHGDLMKAECPACKSPVRSDASVCATCRRDLPPRDPAELRARADMTLRMWVDAARHALVERELQLLELTRRGAGSARVFGLLGDTGQRRTNLHAKLSTLLADVALPAREQLHSGKSIAQQVGRDFRELCYRDSKRMRELLKLAGYTDDGAFAAFVARESAAASEALAAPIAEVRRSAWKDALTQAADTVDLPKCPVLESPGSIRAGSSERGVDVAGYVRQLTTLTGVRDRLTREALREALRAFAWVTDLNDAEIDAAARKLDWGSPAMAASKVPFLDQAGRAELHSACACVIALPACGDPLDGRNPYADYVSASTYVHMIMAPSMTFGAIFLLTRATRSVEVFLFSSFFFLACMVVYLIAIFGSNGRKIRRHRTSIDAYVFGVNASLARQHAVWKSALRGN
ncbi:MAG: hypothetical protein RLZZ299_1443 [Pseudomonadota bacterium]|jgi:hypothetical protein